MKNMGLLSAAGPYARSVVRDALNGAMIMPPVLRNTGKGLAAVAEKASILGTDGVSSILTKQIDPLISTKRRLGRIVAPRYR